MKQLQHIFDSADILFNLADIDRALEQLAGVLNAKYAQRNPLFICVMTGSVITSGHLLPKLQFPLELDYIHVTRYGDKTTGGDLEWKHQPVSDMKGRHVLLIEDIFDEGVTLQTLRDYCQKAGAASVECVCLIEKDHKNKMGTAPEYIGLTVPNRYVFGFGMDYKGYWRNAPGIYAVKDT